MISEAVKKYLDEADKYLCAAAERAAIEKDLGTQGQIMEVQMELDKLTGNDEPTPEERKGEDDYEDEDKDEDEDEDEEDDEEFIEDETEDDDVDAGDENDDDIL